MTDLGSLANLLLKEINEIQAKSLKLEIENEALEMANKRLKETLDQREKWLEEILTTTITEERKQEIYKYIRKDEILQDE